MSDDLIQRLCSVLGLSPEHYKLYNEVRDTLREQADEIERQALRNIHHARRIKQLEALLASRDKRIAQLVAWREEHKALEGREDE